jgi:hypothetical protein
VQRSIAYIAILLNFPIAKLSNCQIVKLPHCQIAKLYLNPSIIMQHLRYLHGVGCGTLAQVVGHDPAVQAIGLGIIPADAAHKHFILPFSV